MEPVFDRHDPLVRALLVVALVLGIALLIQIAAQLVVTFAGIISLFFVAWIIAFIFRTPARFLVASLGIGWPFAVTLVYIALFVVAAAVAWVVVPIVVVQVVSFLQALALTSMNLPNLIGVAQDWLNQRHLPLDLAAAYNASGLPQQLRDLAVIAAQSVAGSVIAIVGLASTTFLTLVLSYFMLLNGDEIVHQLVALVPARRRESARFFLTTVDQVFGAYARGYLILMLLYGVGTALVSLVVGLPFALLFGVIAGLLMVVPIVGGLVAIIPPLIAALATGTLVTVVEVVVILVVLQIALFNLVAPRVFAKAVGLGPLWIFFALLVGARLAGVLGAIFGIPIAAIISAVAIGIYRREVQPRPTEPFDRAA